MKLAEIRINNFRSFADETIYFDDYTCLVGPNGSGKSTVLQALNVFFRNTAGSSINLHLFSDEDFHHKNTGRPIEITLTFKDLSSDAQEDFKAYYRNGKLVVSAVAEWDGENAEVKQYGSRLVMTDFAPFFSGLQAKLSAKELQEIYAGLRGNYSDLPSVSTKGGMEEALRDYEEGHEDLCELNRDENQFYGWSKGDNRLRKYLQWVYVPAVKDAATEQEEGKTTALGQLLQRTIRTKVDFQEPINNLRKDLAVQYESIIKNEQGILDGLSQSLTTRIQEWTHTGTKIELNWHYDRDKSIKINEPLARLAAGEDDFLGEIARLGHGLQRTVFVSLLQELADDGGTDVPVLLLGFEEPELYQHPPQARHMASLLAELSTKNSQILLSTHSPYFVSGKGYENIRMIRKSDDDKQSAVSSVTHEKISEMLAVALGAVPRSPTSTMAAIEQIMQPSQNELFFASIVVLVEGREDVAFISTHLQLTGKWKEFRRHGCHFVVAEGKQNLSRPLAISTSLNIPVFVVFDSDSMANRDKPGDHPRSNKCILTLCGKGEADSMPEEHFWSDNVIMWRSNIGEAVIEEYGAEGWDTAENEAKVEQGFLDGVKRKNPLLITATLETLYAGGKRSELLENLCNRLLDYAQKH
ncbi:MAG: AAA family ATPase [Phycisphaeraceae bacterium]|nr:AAA family ATPase [Phycisphaeraceae bacterium]